MTMGDGSRDPAPDQEPARTHDPGRKPPNVSFETWVEKQIREAMDRGEFDNLPGSGRPITDLDTPYEELWVKRKLEREGLTTEAALPTPLKLRKEAEQLPETVRELTSESQVRAVVDELNARIKDWLLLPRGPAVIVAPVDADAIVAQWREDQRKTDQTATAQRPSRGKDAQRTRWWHRLLRPVRSSSSR